MIQKNSKDPKPNLIYFFPKNPKKSKYLFLNPNIRLQLPRLKRLPVISREHFRKTCTNYFYKHLFGISNTNLKNGISNTQVLKKAISNSNTN
jgi:hypothetical protein